MDSRDLFTPSSVAPPFGSSRIKWQRQADGMLSTQILDADDAVSLQEGESSELHLQAILLRRLEETRTWRNDPRIPRTP